MSLWYDIKGKTYSSTPSDNWCIAYARNIFEKLNAKLTSHLTPGSLKHNAEDIAYSESKTLKDVFDAEVENLKDALPKKVDKVEGKGLSANDFTDAYRKKLNGISPGAEVNLVKSVNGNTGNVVVSKATLELDKVDNTSDTDKPVSSAVRSELDKMMTLEAYADPNQEGQEVQKRVSYAARADTAAFASKSALCEEADTAANSTKLGGVKASEYATKSYVSMQLGDVQTAVDSIIAIQNNLIGGAE